MWTGKAKELYEKLEPLAEAMGLKIIEMDIPGGNNGIFRIYIDSLKGEGVGLEDCAKFSPVVSDYLDAMDVFPFKYYLEVSSPGLDRPIRRWDELELFVGKKVSVKLREKLENRRKFECVLAGVDEDSQAILLKDGERDYRIGKELIRKITLVWEGDK